MTGTQSPSRLRGPMPSGRPDIPTTDRPSHPSYGMDVSSSPEPSLPPMPAATSKERLPRARPRSQLFEPQKRGRERHQGGSGGASMLPIPILHCRTPDVDVRKG